MRILTLLSLIASVLIFMLPSCKQKDNTPACPAVMPAVDNLRFRIIDQAGRDLCVDSNKTPYYRPDSFSAMQPCNGDHKAMSKYAMYQMPGQGYTACCFWFPSLQNPSFDASTDCFQVMLRWNDQDTDTLQWAYYVDELDPCKPQIMLSVSFNGSVLAGPTYDGVYQYYLLRK